MKKRLLYAGVASLLMIAVAAPSLHAGDNDRSARELREAKQRALKEAREDRGNPQGGVRANQQQGTQGNQQGNMGVQNQGNQMDNGNNDGQRR